MFVYSKRFGISTYCYRVFHGTPFRNINNCDKNENELVMSIAKVSNGLLMLYFCIGALDHSCDVLLASQTAHLLCQLFVCVFKVNREDRLFSKAFISAKSDCRATVNLWSQLFLLACWNEWFYLLCSVICILLDSV